MKPRRNSLTHDNFRKIEIKENMTNIRDSIKFRVRETLAATQKGEINMKCILYNYNFSRNKEKKTVSKESNSTNKKL
jgi:hypothetical protein